MKIRTTAGLAALLLTVLTFSGAARTQDKPEQQSLANPQTVEEVQLIDVLDAVRKNSKKTFLIHGRAQPGIVVGQVAVRDTDYAMLLQILRNNDLAAVTVDGMVNVVPVGIIRQYPLPMIPDDDSMHDEEWVTGVLRLDNAPAASVVPIMRPMMPKAGHLSANPTSNSVIIVDRLGNAKRIFSLIRQLDQGIPADSQ